MMSLLSHGAEVEAIFFARPISLGIWVLIFLGVTAVTVLLYRRERGLRPGLAAFLVFLRIAIILLIVAALFEPTMALKESREEKRSLAVLVDTSKSMSLRDPRKLTSEIDDAAAALGFRPIDREESPQKQALKLNTQQRNEVATASRLDLASSLLEKASSGLLKELSKDFDIRYYSFGESLEPLGDGKVFPAKEISKLQADQIESSVSASLRQVASSHRGDSLAGVVLMSDGIETGKGQPEAVAHDLGVRGIPVFTVPIGVPEPDDVAIRNVIIQDVAFVGDTVPVRVQIRSRGYEKRSADLVVTFGEKEVARTEVLFEGGLEFVDVSFDARVKAKGAVPLRVSIEPFQDEATTENNVAERSVRVVNEKINVLCIEGSARWEYRYLRAILKRDPRINATFIATQAGNDLAMHSSDYIARFPEDAEEAFKYDLVILGDVDSAFFTPGEFSRLEELVRERGGSLLMLAGPRHSPTSYEGTPVEPMLPVKFNAKEKWKDIGKSIYPVLTAEGRSSLVLTLEMNREKNDRIWSHVTPMDRLPPLLEPRPGASVLAELNDSGSRARPYPLISWQRYGTGKCMMMATDRLWRLRLRTGDRYHWRVWSQCIQFLTLSRLMGEHKQIRMETDRVSYPEGSQVRIYAEVLDDGYEPILQPRYDVFVGAVNEDDEDSNRASISLRPDASRPGLYAGYFTPSAKGRYRIEAGEDDMDYANSIEFQVAETMSEMASIGAQLESLERVAKLSGGNRLSLGEFPKLSSLLDTKRVTTIEKSEKAMWDNGLFALLLVVLMGCEWIVRRRSDLL
jgi:hypothetical protein